jgi:ABC-type amino acid transport substrate-binding protein
MTQFHKLIFILLFLPNIVLSIELAPLTNTSYLGDFDSLKKKGVIRVLVSTELGFYQIIDGKPIGIISEFLAHFERHLAKKNDHTHIRIIPVSQDDLIRSLKAGIGDIAVGHLAITKSRQRHVDFSTPTIKDSAEWLITAKESPATVIENYRAILWKKLIPNIQYHANFH